MLIHKKYLDIDKNSGNTVIMLII